ncbi:hypothetical protein [Pararhizobium mangrovi]|uniref:Ankyrin repeat domain-containing protein n=1 Tax=Pararhizobium mangrovi TaxID=2590452 RepID=A0A506UFG4_9HYPH|nr:hypothetical protein [Pararhizobium mangrovi]TPW32011.1 hypothetical protein FJU11_02145 [Pararhizobium mangrovi]
MSAALIMLAVTYSAPACAATNTPPDTIGRPGDLDRSDAGAGLPETGMGHGTPAPNADSDDDGADDAASPETKGTTAPIISHDLSQLPQPVRRMRELIVEAARTGDIEKLRPLLDKGRAATQLAISGRTGDPIAYLKGLSGDPDGREVLAIMLDILDAGYARMDVGNGEQTYVWPYFFAKPLKTLGPAQRVQLLRIVTAGDLDNMQETTGGYDFFRLGITPDGRWSFFLAGN